MDINKHTLIFHCTLKWKMSRKIKMLVHLCRVVLFEVMFIVTDILIDREHANCVGIYVCGIHLDEGISEWNLFRRGDRRRMEKVTKIFSRCVTSKIHVMVAMMETGGAVRFLIWWSLKNLRNVCRTPIEDSTSHKSKNGYDGIVNRKYLMCRVGKKFMEREIR